MKATTYPYGGLTTLVMQVFHEGEGEEVHGRWAWAYLVLDEGIVQEARRARQTLAEARATTRLGPKPTGVVYPAQLTPSFGEEGALPHATRDEWGDALILGGDGLMEAMEDGWGVVAGANGPLSGAPVEDVEMVVTFCGSDYLVHWRGATAAHTEGRASEDFRWYTGTVYCRAIEAAEDRLRGREPEAPRA